MSKNTTQVIRYLGTKSLQILKWYGFLIIYLTASSLVSLAGIFSKNMSLASEILGIGLITSGLALALIAWRYNEQLKINNPKHFGKNKATNRKIFIVLGLYLLMNVIQILWSFLIQSKVINLPTNQTEVEQAASLLPLWSNIFAVLVAPIFEELIFRGIFMNYFFNKNTALNNFLAVFTSGLLFGLAHEPTLDLNLLMYSSLGWVLAFTYMYFKDIRYNIFLHFLNNLASII